MSFRFSGAGGAGRTPGEVPARGNIEPSWFPCLLVDLHRHRATGSLKVTGPVHPKALYFRDGRILFGSSNDPRDQLGAILLEGGRITRQHLDEANENVGPGNPLAKVLAESGFVDQRELGDAAREKVERILADVLSWSSGSFEFEDGVLPKGAVDLKLSTQKLLLAAVLRVPDRAFALRHVQLSTVLEPAPEGEATLSEVRSEVWPLFERLDGRRTLEDAIALSRLNEFEAAQTACAMLLLGLVRRKSDAAPAATEDKGDDSPACVKVERTAWQYVTAMHAAAVGGPRAPIRGIVEDVEDMRKKLTRERDEARARVAELEKRLERREAWSRLWRKSFLCKGIDKLRSRRAGAGRAASAGTARASRIEPSGDETAVRRALAMVAAPASTKALVEKRNTHCTLGELLLKDNMVSPQQLRDALNHQKMTGGKLDTALVSLGLLEDWEITSLLSRHYAVPSINLSHFAVDPAILEIIPPATARKYHVLPLSCSGATLTIAMADPTNVLAMNDIRRITGYHVEPVVASASALADAIDHYYGRPGLPGASVRRRDPGGLRLAWSREDRPRDDPEGGPGGDAPAA